MLSNRSLALAAVILCLAGASLACNFRLPGPKPPASPVPVSTEAVESLKQDLRDAAEQAQLGNPVVVELSETQLTSLVAFELQKQTELPLRDPQIFLREGKIQVFATLTQNQVSAPLRIVLAVAVDGNGLPAYTLEEAELGPVALPDDLRSQIEAELDRAFRGMTGSSLEGVTIESIIIQDGLMTIQGRQK
jgi:hypothetical protein